MSVDRGVRDPRRRELLRAGLAACAAAARPLADVIAAQTPCAGAGPAGELLGTLPFAAARPYQAPFGQIVGGEGLDARRFTDLSTLETGQPITPTDRVFLRTAAPAGVAARAARWTIGVTGHGAKPATLPISDLLAASRPMGAHLIECAGNTDPQNFGLMSAAEWDGVPLADVVERLGAPAGAFGVLVNGVDHPAQRSRQSEPGASWILPLDGLERTGAFLALRMNGTPLPLDHGAPVRLVVPGWYGCAWIKWVDELRFVGRDEPATSQMREFAARTHQDGAPELARDYAPAAIDAAAMPVRIEKRRVDGRLVYRIVGVVWGGDRPLERLAIRCSARDPFVPFELCPRPQTHRTWSVWEYRWRPARPGVYDIVLKAVDPAVRTRRLDLFFYVRRVHVTEV